MTHGWCLMLPPLLKAPAEFLPSLGELTVQVRDGSNCHDLVPHTRESAPRASMSSFTGTDKQPMHTDGAYSPTPPRYIALECVNVGETSCPTDVWEIDLPRLKRECCSILTKTMWVFSALGRVPFYSSVVEISTNDIRVRFDQFCMSTAPDNYQSIADVETLLKNYARHISIEWEPGALLIIDNWHCLHARGSGADGAPSRRLRRWSIGAANGLGKQYTL